MTNRIYIKKAMSIVEKLKGGSQALTQAYNKIDDLNKLRDKNNKS